MADSMHDPAGQARPRRRPPALADDRPLHLIDDLARALGGDALRLVAKSDAEHRQALRDGIPDLVRAWELWQSMAPTPTAAEFLAELDRAPTPVAGFTCPRCRRTSHHPDDIRNGYCGACHDYTGADDLSALETLVGSAPPLPWVMPDPDLAGYVAAVTAAVPQLIGMVRRLRVRAGREGSADELGHVVVVYNQVSKQPDLYSVGLHDLEEATELLEEVRKHTRDAGRRETYAIGTVYINDTAEDGQ